MPQPHDDEFFRRHAMEGVLLAGGGAAILLQLADPRIAAGVARHSGFRVRPVDRLIGTHDYLTALAFGDEADRRRIVRRVNARHAPVRGGGAEPATTGAGSVGEGDPGSGASTVSPAYDAFDADAQRWVASTLLAVALDLHERTWGPLGTDVADAIVRAYEPLGTSLQASAAGWPRTRDEFEAWWAERMSRLTVGADARSVAHALLDGRTLPPPLRPLMPLVRLLTAALLPAPIRDAYGFRWTPLAARVAGAWLGAVTTLWPWLPAPLRCAPMRISLRRVRRDTRYAGSDLRGRG